MNNAFLVDGDYVIALRVSHNTPTVMINDFDHTSQHAIQAVVTKNIAVLASIPTAPLSPVHSSIVVNTQLENIRKTIERNETLTEGDIHRLIAVLGYNGLVLIIPTDIILVDTQRDTIRHVSRDTPFSPLASIIGAYLAYRSVVSDKRQAAQEAFRSLYGNRGFFEMDLKEGVIIRV